MWGRSPLCSFACGYLPVPASFAEKTIVSHWIVLAAFSKSIDHKHKGLFLDSQFHSLDPKVILYASTTLSWLLLLCHKLSNEKVLELIFIIFFKSVLAILDALHIRVNFKINFSIFAEKAAWIVIRILLHM